MKGPPLWKAARVLGVLGSLPVLVLCASRATVDPRSLLLLGLIGLGSYGALETGRRVRRGALCLTAAALLHAAAALRTWLAPYESILLGPPYDFELWAVAALLTGTAAGLARRVQSDPKRMLIPDNATVAAAVCIALLLFVIFATRARFARGWVEGTVSVGGRLAPLPQARVILTRDGTRDVAQTVTDGDGRFRFELPPGGYRVTIFKRGYHEVPTAGLTVRGGTVLRPAYVMESDPSAPLSADVPKRLIGQAWVTVSGLARGPGGEPAAGAEIALLNKDARYEAFAVVGPDGTFRALMPHGVIVVSGIRHDALELVDRKTEYPTDRPLQVRLRRK